MMGRITAAIRRFFEGRNGTDQLTIALFVLFFIIYLLSTIPVLRLAGTILSLVLLFIIVFRMLSKNLTARRRENAAFVRTFGKIPAFFKGFGARARDRKTHKYYTCPGCRKKLRVPKGKGRLIVRCPSCQFRFETKT